MHACTSHSPQGQCLLAAPSCNDNQASCSALACVSHAAPEHFSRRHCRRQHIWPRRARTFSCSRCPAAAPPAPRLLVCACAAAGHACWLCLHDCITCTAPFDRGLDRLLSRSVRRARQSRARCIGCLLTPAVQSIADAFTCSPCDRRHAPSPATASIAGPGVPADLLRPSCGVLCRRTARELRASPRGPGLATGSRCAVCRRCRPRLAALAVAGASCCLASALSRKVVCRQPYVMRDNYCLELRRLLKVRP